MNMIEFLRLQVQEDADSEKSLAERNKLGQYATPTPLAEDIIGYAQTLLPKKTKVRFLDPAFGTGAFYSALLKLFPLSQIKQAVGYEINSHYGDRAMKLWSHEGLKLNITDFTKVTPPAFDMGRANLLICNPPYVRHHHLTSQEKVRLQQGVSKSTGVLLNGLSGLYCYFLGLCHAWMAENAIAGWLIPSEFMDVNYGKQVKEYLLKNVTLFRIHRFDPQDVQFDDALVSSAIVWFKNAPPLSDHEIEFSYGGTLRQPKHTRHVSVNILKNHPKWTQFPISPGISATEEDHVKLGDLFSIKRGIATGANNYFVLTPEQVEHYHLPTKFLIPLLPSSRYIKVDEIQADEQGQPKLQKRFFLLSCNLPDAVVQAEYPQLWDYLQIGVEKGINKGYLCSHRSPWYAQERRPAPLFLCTYMGRKANQDARPFRFILNHSNATALNVYLLLYPKEAFKDRLIGDQQFQNVVLEALKNISMDTLLGEGRVYGGGLHKIEPKELANASIRFFPFISN